MFCMIFFYVGIKVGILLTFANICQMKLLMLKKLDFQVYIESYFLSWQILDRGFWKNPDRVLWSSVVFVVRCCSLLFVVVGVVKLLFPPMISLNGWRYEILVMTKKFRLDVEMCYRKKNPKKVIFSAPMPFFPFRLCSILI